jgi:hypothetical protein
MRFIITARPDDSKPRTDVQMDDDLFATYMKFNEELQKAGVLVASEGLNPGAPGARIGVSGGQRKVLDGPFAEAKELVGGFWVIEVASLEEAKRWALRAPTGMGTDDILEIRQLTASEDIPKHFLDLAISVAPTWTATFAKKR